jgi:small subunit ribosomal protein S17
MTKEKEKKDNNQVESGQTRPRLLQGKVVGGKMSKTVVVLVNRFKQHPKYKKRYLISKKYKAHSESGQYKVGDRVIIKECRPMSRDKKWIVVKKR